MEDGFDHVVRYCAHCDEEYQLPEDMEKCPLCDHVLPDEDSTNDGKAA